MAFPEGNLAPVPSDITVGSALKDALDALDPKREDPEFDFQLGRTLHFSIETQKGVSAAIRVIATTGRMQRNTTIKR